MKGVSETVLALHDNPPEIYLAPLGIHGPSGAPGRVIIETDFGNCPWAIACVGSRSEKLLARELFSRNIPYFLPYTREIRAYTPLFPGIVFFQGHDEPVPEGYSTHISPRELEVKKIKGVWKLLKTGNQRRLRRELTLIAEESPDQRTLRLATCPQGAPVEVQDGIGGYIQGRFESSSQKMPAKPGEQIEVTIRMELWGQWVARTFPAERVRLVQQ